MIPKPSSDQPIFPPSFENNFFEKLAKILAKLAQKIRHDQVTLYNLTLIFCVALCYMFGSHKMRFEIKRSIHFAGQCLDVLHYDPQIIVCDFEILSF